MNWLMLLCAMTDGDLVTFKEPGSDKYKGHLIVTVEEGGKSSQCYLSPESEARLYEFLSERRGITPPAEPDALTRIAVASERTADALEKLASYATEDGLAESARIP